MHESKSSATEPQLQPLLTINKASKFKWHKESLHVVPQVQEYILLEFYNDTIAIIFNIYIPF